MIFSDERDLFVSEIEDLSQKLANKSAKEIEQILDDGNYRLMYLAYKGDDLNTFKNRLALPFIVPILCIICLIKWIISGDYYLDSWARKFKIVFILLRLIDANYGVKYHVKPN